MLFNIEDDKVKGEGKQLWAVISIDTEDHEDTSTEFWRANDEDHLYEQAKKSFLGVDQDEEVEDDDQASMFVEKFDEEWGFEILYKLIGDIKE